MSYTTAWASIDPVTMINSSPKLSKAVQLHLLSSQKKTGVPESRDRPEHY